VRHCCNNVDDLFVRRGAASLAPVLAGQHAQLLESVHRQLAGRGARGNVVHTFAIGVATRHVCPRIGACLCGDGARLTDLVGGVTPSTPIQPATAPRELCEPPVGPPLGTPLGIPARPDVRLQWSSGDCTLATALALLCHSLLSATLP
jgi:hypothetical protein